MISFAEIVMVVYNCDSFWRQMVIFYDFAHCDRKRTNSWVKKLSLSRQQGELPRLKGMLSPGVTVAEIASKLQLLTNINKYNRCRGTQRQAAVLLLNVDVGY